MFIRPIRALGITALALFAIPASHASPGDVDPRFGQAGQIQSAGVLNSLPDGSLIGVVTQDSKSVLVTHWDANGVPDPAFGPTGTRLLAIPFETYPGMATRTGDGKFYIWGARPVTREDEGFSDMAIVRLNADGTLDQSFAAGGVLWMGTNDLVLEIGYGDIATGLIVEPDGHLLVCDAEYGDFYSSPDHEVIRKYDQSGAVDLSFGAGTGAVALPSGFTVNHFFTPFALTGTGLIRIAGSSILYLNADGSPASAPVSYSSLHAGVASWEFAGELPNGDTLIAGESEGGAVLVARVRADGTLETSFGGSGTGYAQFPGRTLSSPNYAMHSTFLSADYHHLYVALSSATPGGGMALARLNVDGPASGTLDRQFSPSGIVELNADWLQVDGVVEQTNGAVLVSTYERNAFRLLPVDSASPGFVSIGGTYSGAAGITKPVSGTTTVYVPVARIAGKDGIISVHYSTGDLNPSTDGSDEPVGSVGAVAGVDYLATSGTLTWADGDVTDKTVAIEILAGNKDSLAVARTFSLNFDSVQGDTFVYVNAIQLTVNAPQAVPQQALPATAAPDASAGNGGGGPMDGELVVLLVGALHAMRRRRRQQ